MTLPMTYEAAVQRGGRRVFRPFTADEDATIRRMAAERYTIRQIADATGRQYHSIRHRADALGVTIDAKEEGKVGHCTRCAILLSAAPAGRDERCGWCTNDR